MKSILIILILFTIYSCQESIRDQLKEYKIGNQFVEITPVERLKYFMLINLSGLNSNQFGFLHDFKNKGIIFYDKNNLYKPYFIEHGDRVIKIDGTEIGEGISSSLETELLKINYIMKFYYLFIADIKSIQTKIHDIEIIRKDKKVFLRTYDIHPAKYRHIEKKVFPKLEEFIYEGELNEMKAKDYENTNFD